MGRYGEVWGDMGRYGEIACLHPCRGASRGRLGLGRTCSTNGLHGANQKGTHMPPWPHGTYSGDHGETVCAPKGVASAGSA